MSVKLREKPLKDGRKSLYLDIYQNGKRRYEFLKMYLTGNKDEDKYTLALAEDIKSKTKMKLLFNSQGHAAPAQQKADFIEYFSNAGKGLEPSTRKQYRNVLKKLKEYAGDKVKFSEINRRWVEGFKEYLLKDVSANTARIYFAMFQASLNRAVKKEIISENPAKNVSLPKKTSGKKIPYLTIDELKTLSKAECPDPEIKAAFLFSCYTGLRYSDIEKLTWDDVNSNQLELKQVKTQDTVYIPLGNQAKYFIEGRDKEGLVFRLPTNAHVNKLLKTWAENANLKKWIRITDPDTGEVLQQGLTYHVSRHTFAVMTLKHGGDIYTLKDLLGHQSLESTEVYAKVVNKTKRTAIDNLPGL